ncbi:MAG: hypothetical protein WCX83_00395 [Candidatus Cloacimonas sp.]
MSLKTLGQQLEEVQTAITAVMSGQSYSIAGRSMSKANLNELTMRESTLLDRVAKYGYNYNFETSTTQKAVKNVVFS